MQPRRFSCTTEGDLAWAGQLQAPKARLACRTGVLAGELRLQSVPMATMVELRGLESPTFSLQRLRPVPTDVLQCSDSAESRCMRTMIMTALGAHGITAILRRPALGRVASDEKRLRGILD